MIEIWTGINDPDGNPGQYGHYWTGSTLKDGPNPYTDAVCICFGKAQGKMESPPNSGSFVLLDVHGAGAQRSDTKSGIAADYPDFAGPQGDVVYVYNFMRCVRNMKSLYAVEKFYDVKDIEIFPNPAKDIITIRTESPCSIRITDLSGKVLFHDSIQSNTKSIHIEDFNRGVYLLQLRNAHWVERKKFIVK